MIHTECMKENNSTQENHMNNKSEVITTKSFNELLYEGMKKGCEETRKEFHINKIQTLEKEKLELLEKLANIENRIYELKSEVK